MNAQKFILDISWVSIAKIAVALFVLYLIWLVGPLLILVLFALIISVLFAPVVDVLQDFRVPRGLAVIAIYGFVFGVLGILFYLSVPVFVTEIQKFASSFPQYFEQLSPILRSLGIEAFDNIETFLGTIQSTLLASSSNIINSLFAVFGGILSTIFVVTTGIFLSLERRPVEATLELLAPPRYQNKILAIWELAKRRVTGWFLSRLVASLFVAVGSYIAFIIIGAPFPVSLAIFGGVLNFIPIFGPIVAGAMIFLLPAFDNLVMGLIALAAFTLVQQIENNVVTPLLTKRFVGLSPALVLIAFAIGGQLWGVLGAILTIPLFAVILEFVKGFLKVKKEGGLYEKEEELEPGPENEKAMVV